MGIYSENVWNSIVPKSYGDSLPDVFDEWFFTDEVIDHEEPVETCELCGQENLRYHFEIENRMTEETMWVGSHCILKFDLSVFEDGLRLSPPKAKKRLDRLVEEMRHKSCLKALSALAEEEDNEILSNALEFYSRKGYLTPKFAFVVFWRLNTHGIDHVPSFFKVSLIREPYREDLRAMEPSRVRLIWPALSSSQRKAAIEMGHKLPR